MMIERMLLASALAAGVAVAGLRYRQQQRRREAEAEALADAAAAPDFVEPPSEPVTEAVGEPDVESG